MKRRVRVYQPCVECGNDNFPEFKAGGDWIQGVTKSIKARGTEGKCSGSNFGGPGCPPGSRQYNLAVTFKNMAKKQFGGSGTAPQNTDLNGFGKNRLDYFKNFVSGQAQNVIKEEEYNNAMKEAEMAAMQEQYMAQYMPEMGIPQQPMYQSGGTAATDPSVYGAGNQDDLSSWGYNSGMSERANAYFDKKIAGQEADKLAVNNMFDSIQPWQNTMKMKTKLEPGYQDIYNDYNKEFKHQQRAFNRTGIPNTTSIDAFKTQYPDMYQSMVQKALGGDALPHYDFGRSVNFSNVPSSLTQIKPTGSIGWDGKPTGVTGWGGTDLNQHAWYDPEVVKDAQGASITIPAKTTDAASKIDAGTTAAAVKSVEDAKKAEDAKAAADATETKTDADKTAADAKATGKTPFILYPKVNRWGKTGQAPLILNSEDASKPNVQYRKDGHTVKSITWDHYNNYNPIGSITAPDPTVDPTAAPPVTTPSTTTAAPAVSTAAPTNSLSGAAVGNTVLANSPYGTPSPIYNKGVKSPPMQYGGFPKYQLAGSTPPPQIDPIKAAAIAGTAGPTNINMVGASTMTPMPKKGMPTSIQLSTPAAAPGAAAATPALAGPASRGVYGSNMGTTTARPGKDWGLIASQTMGPAMDFAAMIGRNRTEGDWQQKMENATNADQVFTPGYGDQGYNTFNSVGNDFVKRNTPVQFTGMGASGMAAYGGQSQQFDQYNLPIFQYQDGAEVPADGANYVWPTIQNPPYISKDLRGPVSYPPEWFPQNEWMEEGTGDAINWTPEKVQARWEQQNRNTQDTINNLGEYQEGGTYELSDEEIKQIMQAGGQVEYL